jgi:hypothetical protein
MITPMYYTITIAPSTASSKYGGHASVKDRTGLGPRVRIKYDTMFSVTDYNGTLAG